MQDKKSQGQVVYLSISMRRGVLEQLDEFGKAMKENTGFNVARSKLIAILATLAHDAQGDIDYRQVHDEATLQQELERAIFRKIQREQERKP